MSDFIIGLATVLISAGVTYLIARRFTAQDVATEADRAARESSRADVAWDRADRRSERLNALLEATEDAILRVGSDLVIRAASPVTGEILQHNENIKSDASIVNTEAENDGWVLKVLVEDPKDIEELMDAKAYAKYVEENKH